MLMQPGMTFTIGKTFFFLFLFLLFIIYISITPVMINGLQRVSLIHNKCKAHSHSHFFFFFVEPIVCLGTDEYVLCDDNWTAVSKDASLAVQYEHTILITPHGKEILTE